MIKHFTATVYIISRFGIELKVLLHKHKHLGFWMAVGGHIEKNENPMEAAVREAKEETGMTVRLIDSVNNHLKTAEVNELIPPFNVQEELIPARDGQPEHIHIDCIFAGTAADLNSITMKEEYQWYTEKEVISGNFRTEVKKNTALAFKIAINRS